MLIDKVEIISDPVARSMRTSRARPNLASHAPKDRITIEKKVSVEVKNAAEAKKVRDRIMASRERRAIRTCLR